MRILHITDIHLDHLEESTKPAYVGREEPGSWDKMKDFMDFYNNKIREEDIDFIVLTGDISVSQFLPGHLEFLQKGIKCPIYFILGNHDFYNDTKIFGGNSMKTAEYYSENSVVMYLTQKPYLEKDYVTDKKVGFVGVDGWYDGKYSDFYKSDLYMTDFSCIGEIHDANMRFIHEKWMAGHFQPMFAGNLAMSYHMEHGLSSVLKQKFQETAEQYAVLLRKHFDTILKEEPETIVVATHVPPFIENSINKGKVSDDQWLPFFSSKSIGDVLLKYAEKNPGIQFLVLCGHSHGDGEYKPLDNLICLTTDAEYGQIHPGRVLEV